MGTRLNRIAEAVLTSVHNLCFEQKYEKYQNFHLKTFSFWWWNVQYIWIGVMDIMKIDQIKGKVWHVRLMKIQINLHLRTVWSDLQSDQMHLNAHFGQPRMQPFFLRTTKTPWFQSEPYKPTTGHVRPAKTQISLRISAGWSESALIAYAFYSLRAFLRGINENPCHSG